MTHLKEIISYLTDFLENKNNNHCHDVAINLI